MAQAARRREEKVYAADDRASVIARPAIGCEHRTVSKDGRILCKKIVEGDNEVSPNVCRDCPMRAVNCEHLRFSLRLSSPSPLTVRFNGRTEIWDDGPPALAFERAACAARVVPIHGPRACAGCTLRQEHLPAQPEPAAAEAAGHPAKVVAFPGRQAGAAAD
ncbi:MAG: hypothetical protein PVF47_16085 [Anaerolineae bacterium]|jgi:hypothetical protein